MTKVGLQVATVVISLIRYHLLIFCLQKKLDETIEIELQYSSFEVYEISFAIFSFIRIYGMPYLPFLHPTPPLFLGWKKIKKNNAVCWWLSDDVYFCPSAAGSNFSTLEETSEETVEGVLCYERYESVFIFYFYPWIRCLTLRVGFYIACSWNDTKTHPQSCCSVRDVWRGWGTWSLNRRSSCCSEIKEGALWGSGTVLENWGIFYFYLFIYFLGVLNCTVLSLLSSNLVFGIIFSHWTNRLFLMPSWQDWWQMQENSRQFVPS